MKTRCKPIHGSSPTTPKRRTAMLLDGFQNAPADYDFSGILVLLNYGTAVIWDIS
jgi:hypothetical protein